VSILSHARIDDVLSQKVPSFFWMGPLVDGRPKPKGLATSETLGINDVSMVLPDAAGLRGGEYPARAAARSYPTRACTMYVTGAMRGYSLTGSRRPPLDGSRMHS
jgi:hypothetical protein